MSWSDMAAIGSPDSGAVGLGAAAGSTGAIPSIPSMPAISWALIPGAPAVLSLPACAVPSAVEGSAGVDWVEARHGYDTGVGVARR